MPAKKQVPREDIVNAALVILRESGMDAVNARSLAKKLHCSTQPIYLSFQGMDELKEVVAERVREIYADYLKKEVERAEMPIHKAYGMGYIRFAKEEKEMFRYLFMRKRSAGAEDEAKESTEAIVNLIMEKNGLSREEAFRFHMELWIFVHGFATMIATSYLDWDWETVSGMVTDAYLGIKSRYTKE